MRHVTILIALMLSISGCKLLQNGGGSSGGGSSSMPTEGGDTIDDGSEGETLDPYPNNDCDTPYKFDHSCRLPDPYGTKASYELCKYLAYEYTWKTKDTGQTFYLTDKWSEPSSDIFLQINDEGVSCKGCGGRKTNWTWEVGDCYIHFDDTFYDIHPVWIEWYDSPDKAFKFYL